MTYVFVSFRPPYLCPSKGHKLWVEHFFKYLPHETSHRPKSLRDCLNIHLLLSLWFLTLFVEWIWWWCDSENRQYTSCFPVFFSRDSTAGCMLELNLVPRVRVGENPGNEVSRTPRWKKHGGQWKRLLCWCLFDIETPRSEFSNNESSPLSPGEVRMMRNHPKIASVLFSPSRKSLGDGKIKPKSFSSSLLYASPSRKTVIVFCFSNFKR